MFLQKPYMLKQVFTDIIRLNTKMRAEKLENKNRKNLLHLKTKQFVFGISLIIKN